MQSPDPRGDFFKARQPEMWAIDKEQACTKTALVLTGTELVKTAFVFLFSFVVMFTHSG